MKASYDVLLHTPSLKGGGAERVAVEVAGYFAAHRKSVAIFVHDGEFSYDLPGGIEVVVARRRGHLQRVAEFRALLRQADVGAVLSFLPYANLISLLACIGLARRPRLVVSEHQSYADFRPAGLKERLKFALLTWLYPASDVIVAVSGGVADDLRRRVRGSARRKVVVIHNPCHVPDATASPVPRDATGRVVLSVGRLIRQKGFDTLINAFPVVVSKMPDARLVIVGEGPQRSELEALVVKLGLEQCVTLPGFTRDIAAHYRRADLFALSSRAEGFGNVLVEALSFGLPVVSTACPHGPAEILEGGRYGTLVPVDDEAALAEAIVNALDTPVDTEAQIARAREFSLDVIGPQYAKAARLTE